MVKRELIDREKAENTTWEEPSYTDALNVLTEVRDKIRELPVITEQEIAKSYLKKLRAKINEEIDFEEKWLNDVFWKDKGITLRDIEIAMNGIRHVVKGELEE